MDKTKIPRLQNFVHLRQYVRTLQRLQHWGKLKSHALIPLYSTSEQGLLLHDGIFELALTMDPDEVNKKVDKYMTNMTFICTRGEAKISKTYDGKDFSKYPRQSTGVDLLSSYKT